MKLIIGLGNPGKEYAHNRHNVGFRCINYLAKIHSIAVKQHQCQSQIGVGEIAGKKVVLAKPKTYMNNSGNAVGRLVQKYGISIEDIIVIYDDMDLPIGKVRLRQVGRSAGHKGIKSIISALRSEEFLRIRLGIGRPPGEQDSSSKEDIVINYVLSDFTPEEDGVIKPVIAKASDAVECILREGLLSAMNKFN